MQFKSYSRWTRAVTLRTLPVQARVFVCLSKQERDKFQTLHPPQKFCSEEGQDGKFGKQIRRGLCRRGCPSVLLRGDLRWAPHQPPPGRPGAAGNCGGGGQEGTGWKSLPHTGGIPCACRQNGWREEKRISRTRAVRDKLWQPLHPFLWGAEISCLCLVAMPWFVSILV